MLSFFRSDPITQFKTLYTKITDYVDGTAGSTEPTQQTIAQLYNYGYDAINNSPEDVKDDKTTSLVSKLEVLTQQITRKINSNPEPKNKTQLEQTKKRFTFFDKLNFTFFRHSNSCNNTEVGEVVLKVPVVGYVVNKDMDPSLSLVGLIDTIDFQKDIKKPKYIETTYRSNSTPVLQVYTSALLRPILTAIILYGTAAAAAEEKRKQDEAIADTIASTSPTGLTIADALAAADSTTAAPPRTPNNRVLELNVSPFLNEQRLISFLKRGNYPESPDQMRTNVGNFLDTLSKLYTVNSLDIIPGEEERRILNGGLNFFFNELSDTIVVKLPKSKSKNDTNNQIWCFVYTRQGENKYTCTFVGTYKDYLDKQETLPIALTTIPDNISKKDKAIDGAQEGDIYKFINWVKDGNNFYNSNLTDTNITVVTHSETMNKFMREHRSNDTANFNFKAQNCSSFKIARPFGEKMGIDPSNGITLSNVHDDIGLLQSFEEENKALSLCGKYKKDSNVRRQGAVVSKPKDIEKLLKLPVSVNTGIGGKHRKTKRRTKIKRHKKTTRKYKKYGKTRKHHKK